MNIRKKLMIGAGVLMIPLIISGLIELAYRRAFADLRKKGYPASLEELNTYYPSVPDVLIHLTPLSPSLN